LKMVQYPDICVFLGYPLLACNRCDASLNNIPYNFEILDTRLFWKVYCNRQFAACCLLV